MRYLFGNAPAEISPALDSSSVLNPESFASSEQLEGCAEQLAGGRVLRIGGTSATDFLALLRRRPEAIEIAEAELTGTATGERVPVEEWLHDNLHVVREQMWAVRRDLSRGYYHSLPKLADAPFAGLPRVYALACDLTARTGGRIDPEVLKRFVQAYQRVTELLDRRAVGPALDVAGRAAAASRAADREVLDRRRQRAAARRFVTGYQRAVERAPATFRVDVHLPRTPSPTYIVSSIHDLRDLPPAASALWQGARGRLGARDTRFDDITQQGAHAQAFLQLAVSNLIGSMRRTSAIDWQQFVEDVKPRRRGAGQDPSGRYAQMDFETAATTAAPSSGCRGGRASGKPRSPGWR